MIKFVDLFAGIGGIRTGLEKAFEKLNINNNCVLSSEIDKKACETYRLNFQENPLGDIKEILKPPDFDFLLAGFPCQPFSYAGKKRGFGDTRGTLFFEVERFLKTKKPKGFLLENVRGFTTHDKGRTLETVIEHLENLGYGVEYRILNSCNHGAPQNRVRVYIVGLLGSKPKLAIKSDLGSPDSHKFKLNRMNISLFEEKKYVLVKDILEKEVDSKYHCTPDFIQRLERAVGNNLSKLNGVRLIDYRNGNSLHSWELGIKGECTKEEIDFMNILIANRRKKHFGSHQDGKKLTAEQIKTFFNSQYFDEITKGLIHKGYLKLENNKYNPVCGNMSFEIFKFLDPESIAITLVSSDANKLGVVQNNIPRHITPRECARIQGFPDSFTCHPQDVSSYKQFGNSVTVPVVTDILYDLFLNNYQNLINYEEHAVSTNNNLYPTEQMVLV